MLLKTTYLLTLLFFLLRPVHSIAAEYYVGIKGGFTSSNVTDPTSSNISRKRFSEYASFSIKTIDYFAIQIEMGYSMKGYKTKSAGDLFDSLGNLTGSYSDNHIYNYDYLEIPFLAKIMFGKNKPISFFCTIGPALGFLISAKMESNYEENGSSFNFTRDDKDEMNKIDFSSIIGTGFGITSKHGIFSLEVRYLQGARSIFNPPSMQDRFSSYPFYLYNNSVSLLAGYTFKL